MWIERQLKEIKKGTEFKRKPNAQHTFTKGVFVRDDNLNKYECTDVEDINGFIYLKGSTTVYIEQY